MDIQPLDLIKLSLVRKADERLKIFFIIARPEKLPPLDFWPVIKDEHVHGILAYRPEEAMALARAMERRTGIGDIWTGDFAYVDELLGKVERVQTVFQPGDPPPLVKTDPPKMVLPSREQFVCNLMMVSKEMTQGILSDKDQSALFKLLNIIYESRTAPASQTGEEKKSPEGLA